MKSGDILDFQTGGNLRKGGGGGLHLENGGNDPHYQLCTCMLCQLFWLYSSTPFCSVEHPQYSYLVTSYGSHHIASYVVNLLVICHQYNAWNLSQSQHNMSLIELSPRCHRRSVIQMQSFKNTPHIHLIVSLSAVTNCWTYSFRTCQVLLPYKSTFLTHMLKKFPQSVVRITCLVRIVSNSLSLWPSFWLFTILSFLWYNINLSHLKKQFLQAWGQSCCQMISRGYW